ncbi:FKBP-type peptidyl-prolyl cis-trans isomerase [Aequorivita capsosiphonis]|uniref:FKBP-type peptidyl-prolyl cis-trans isomerase n=1 Tax=Aequorivita capsosiphonis TaxID=487317 RepID=UPI001FE19BB0|nr:hypothetical protein [Aequorivita capsosiphonis]
MMKIKYGFALLIVMLVVTVSCKKDDDDGPAPIPPRDRGEEAIRAQAEIEAFLETHFYNYEDFDADPNNFKIKFDTIAGENASKTPLIEQVTSKVVNDIFDTDVDYKLYLLKVREGGGERPHFSDYTTTTYDGRLMNLDLFDSSVIPIKLNLVNGKSAQEVGVIRGLQQALIEFKGAVGEPITNPDGTLSFEDFGIGAVFIPSGLGYFQSSRGDLDAYGQLIFSFQLFASEVADHDGDGIPSYMEDLNNNQYLFDDDTDGNGLPNYLDNDDDGDGRLTKFEIEIIDGEIFFPDTNGNGTPDYLDDTI